MAPLLFVASVSGPLTESRELNVYRFRQGLSFSAQK